MNMIRRPSNLSNDRLPNRAGALTVEFALTVPISLLLTFSLVEFARVNMIRNTLDNAVYEGARAAIVPGGTAAQAEVRARRVADSIGVTGAVVTVSPAVITDATAKVTVTVTVPLEQNLWLVPTYFSGRALTKSCSLTREWTGSVR